MGDGDSQNWIDDAANFKRYVHQRLTAMGVPNNPNPEKNSNTGCRIGCRLDYLNGIVAEIEEIRDEMWVSVGDDKLSEETKRIVGEFAKKLVEALKIQST
jgi:hypothetical protein